MRLHVDLNTAQGPKDHGIDRPRVTDTQSGRVLLDLWDSWDWDAKVVRNERATVVLAMRHNPGKAHATLEIDAEAGTYRLTHVSGWWRVRSLRARLKAAGLKRA